VLEFQDFDPIQIDPNSPFDNCVHGEEGCSLCAMACLRLDPKIDVIEQMVFGERRRIEKPEGEYRFKTLARATDERVLARGQDGGAVTALLTWGMDNGELDGAVVAAPSPDVPWLDEPKLVQSSQELLNTAGSRYTYCSTPLGLRQAAAAKLKNVAVVGVSCESTAVREFAAEGIKRWTRGVKLVIGLMCCETFDYEAFMIGKVEQELGIPLDEIKKVNVKGKVIVTLDDGRDIDIPLKDARPFANEWCHHCPDFAAEHADLSCGGLGMAARGGALPDRRSARASAGGGVGGRTGDELVRNLEVPHYRRLLEEFPDLLQRGHVGGARGCVLDGFERFPAGDRRDVDQVLRMLFDTDHHLDAETALERFEGRLHVLAEKLLAPLDVFRIHRSVEHPDDH
jgi:coenzyme F420 hydrogenase subunit beta